MIGVLLSLQLLLLLQPHYCQSQQEVVPGSSIRFTDQSYRKYAGQRDPVHPWKDGVDIMSKRGFHMVPVQGEPSDEPVTQIQTALGAVGLSADPQFVLQDFHVAYGIPTIWPYCESVNKCLVYNQPTSPAWKSPIEFHLPSKVSAIDLYIDAAIDCIETLRVVVSCKVRVQPGDVEVKFHVQSICSSPNVGKYIGFLDESGGYIERLTIKCKSTYPNALALIRIGSRHPVGVADSIE